MKPGNQRIIEKDDSSDDLRGKTADSPAAENHSVKRSRKETPGIIVAVVTVLLLICAFIYLGVCFFETLPELGKKPVDNKTEIELSKVGDTSADDGRGQGGRGSAGTGKTVADTGSDTAGTDASGREAAGTDASGTGASGTEAVDTDIRDNENEAMTSGNFFNRGYFAYHNGDCYFLYNNALLRSNGQDFSETERLTQAGGPKYLNVYRGRVYFLDNQSHIIYRLEPDGGEKVRVFGGSGDSGE